MRVIDIHPMLNGSMLESVQINLAPPSEKERGEQQLTLHFTRDGASFFRQLTEMAQNSRLAIVLNGRAISTPSIQEPLSHTKTITFPATLSNQEAEILTGIPRAISPATTDASEAPERVESIATAIARARIWLQVIDAGPDHYAQSWRDASAGFRDSVTESDWVAMLKAGRPSFGSVISRQLISSQETRTLPGAPDAHYVVMQFATEFSRKKSATETVTFVQESDETWRPSGYFIK